MPPTGTESSEAAPFEPAPRDLDTAAAEAEGRSPEREDGTLEDEPVTAPLPTMVELDVLSAELDDIDTVLARMDDRESDPASG